MSHFRRSFHNFKKNPDFGAKSGPNPDHFALKSPNPDRSPEIRTKMGALHTRPYSTIWYHMGPYWTLLDHKGPYRPIRVHRDHTRPQPVISSLWCCFKLFGYWLTCLLTRANSTGACAPKNPKLLMSTLTPPSSLVENSTIFFKPSLWSSPSRIGAWQHPRFFICCFMNKVGVKLKLVVYSSTLSGRYLA